MRRCVCTLFDVIEFYDEVPENPNVGRREVDLLPRQLDDVKAFNDESFDKRSPLRVPSGLNPGGRIH